MRHDPQGGQSQVARFFSARNEEVRLYPVYVLFRLIRETERRAIPWKLSRGEQEQEMQTRGNESPRPAHGARAGGAFVLGGTGP